MKRLLVAAILLVGAGCAADGPFARREYEPDPSEGRGTDQRSYNAYDYPYDN